MVRVIYTPIGKESPLSLQHGWPGWRGIVPYREHSLFSPMFIPNKRVWNHASIISLFSVLSQLEE